MEQIPEHKIKYRYSDFVLKIDRTEMEYIVEAQTGQRTPKKSPLALPQWSDELASFTQYFEQRAEQSENAQIKGQVMATDQVRQFGRQLFKTLFRGPILALYRQALQTIKAEDSDAADGYARGLRLILDLEDAPELTRIPWEFVYDAEQKNFLCLDPQTPLVRRLQPGARGSTPEKPPLIFGLFSATPGGKTPLGKIQTEIRAVEDILKTNPNLEVRPHRLAATATDLIDAMKDWPHIIHFTGHGTGRRLAFEDTDLSAEQINRILSNSQRLRLVIINACEAGEEVTTMLARNGIPAIIAMQFKVTDLAGMAFAREFYKNLIAGHSLEASLSFTRLAMSVALPNVESFEWVTPVLYLQTTGENVLGEALSFSKEDASDLSELRLPEAREKIFGFFRKEGQNRRRQGKHREALAFLQEAKRLSQTDPAFGAFEEDITNNIHSSNLALSEERRRARLQLSKEILFKQAGEYATEEQWEKALNLLGTISQLHLVEQTSPEAEPEHPSLNLPPEVNDLYQRVREARERTFQIQARQIRLEALFQKAEAGWSKQDWEEAIIFFEKADEEAKALTRSRIDLAPDYQNTEQRATQARRHRKLRYLYQRGVSRIEKEEWQQAVEIFKQIADIDPTYEKTQEYLAKARQEKELDDTYRQGIEAVRAKQWRPAISALQTIPQGTRRYDDGVIALNYAQGRLHMEEENWPQAVEALDYVRRLRPGFEGDAQKQYQEALFRRDLHERYQSGCQHMSLKEWQAAKADLQWVQDQQRSQRAKVYADIEDRLSQIDEEISLADQFRQAQRFYATGNWKKTIDLLSNIHQQRADYEGKSGEMLNQAQKKAKIEEAYDRGREASLKNSWDRAIHFFEQVLSLEPAHQEAAKGLETAKRNQAMEDNYQKGINAYRAGVDTYNLAQLDEAMAHFERVVQLDASFRDAEERLKETKRLREAEQGYQAAEKAEKIKDWSQAVKNWQQVIELGREPNRAYRDSAQRLKVAIHQEELANLYRQAEIHRRNQAWVEAKAVLTDLSVRAKSYGLSPYAEAEKWLDEATRQAEIAELYEGGELCMKTERWDDAITFFKQVLELNRTHRLARSQLAEARRQCQLKTDYQQGLIAFQAKDWKSSIGHFERVVKEERQYKDATGRLETARYQLKLVSLFKRGQNFANQDQWDQAFACFDEIKRADPDYPHIQSWWNRAFEYKEISRLYQLARKLEEEGNLEEAIKHYDEVEKRKQNVQ